jgi:hypothetical protein
VVDLRISFWGSRNEKAPTQSERAEKIATILKNAWSVNQRSFTFLVGERKVCEVAMLILLGLSTNNTASAAPYQWKRLKKLVMNFDHTSKEDFNYKEKLSTNGNAKAGSYDGGSAKSVLQKEDSKHGRYRRKYSHAESYIRYIAKIMSDTSPFAG